MKASVVTVSRQLVKWSIGTVVEAYPVDLGRKQSVSASELYHGMLSTFLRAGFAEVARPVVRLSLAGPQAQLNAASAASQQKAGNNG
jgi:hypothetical protein